MFNTLSPAQLQVLLDQFSVPMFALDRVSADRTFRIVCINQTLENVTGRSKTQIIGRTAFDLMPPDEASLAKQHYDSCARSGKNIRFSDTFTLRDRRVMWDTTLQHAKSPDGNERIIGTTLPITPSHSPADDVATYEDVRYFTALADLQLENMATACDLVSAHSSAIPEVEFRVAKLHRICRTVQRTVSDIKQVVRQAQMRREAQNALHPSQTPRETALSGREVGLGTVLALSDLSLELEDRAG